MGISRDDLAAALTAAGIDTSVHFIPVHQLSYFRDMLGDHAGLLPGTDRAADRVLSLPMYPALTAGQVESVCDAIASMAGPVARPPWRCSMLELTGRPRRARLPRDLPMRGLLIGAGKAGRTMAQSLRRAPDYGVVPIGFLDDDPSKPRRQGFPCSGASATLPEIATEWSVDAALVTIPSLPHIRIAEITELALSVGLTVRYLSSFVSTLERDARLTDLRSVRVDGLLGRDELHVVRPSSRSVVAGKRVLVTGAGGSIGSELCRQIDRFRPAALYMLDHDESNLHTLQLHLTGQGLSTPTTSSSPTSATVAG